MDQPRHQIHQRRLARAVGTDETGDARRNIERHTVHTEHFTVELRDLVEDQSGGLRPAGPPFSLTRYARSLFGHRMTSIGRSLRSMTAMRRRAITTSANADAAAPGPRGASTPRSAHQTRFTVHAGSMMWPHLTRSTLSIISAMPLRMKKNARLTAAATPL